MPEKPREINGPLSPRWTPERPFFDRWVPATARDPLDVPDPPPDLYELTDDDVETCRASGIQVTDGKPNCDEIEQKLVAECDISPGQLPTLTWPTILGLLKRAIGSHADAGAASLPTLQPHDRKAYKLSMLDGWTQDRIAEKLNNQHGTKYKQGQVSRMIQRAQVHAVASGLSRHIPDIAKTTKPAMSMDPGKLDLGARTDHMAPRQRSKRDSDSD